MVDQVQAERVAADLRARWAQAFAERDAAGLASLYTPGALFFGSRPQLFLGREGVAAYFSGLAPDVVLEEFEPPVVADVAPEVFATAGFWRFRFGALPARYRLTWVVVGRAGNWLIAQHHAAPLDAFQAGAPPPTT